MALKTQAIWRVGRCLLTLGLAVWFSQVCLTAAVAQSDVYFADTIWTGDGDPIRGGALLVRDGTVVKVAPREEFEVPDDAQVHELGSHHVIPGLVVAQTSLVESTSADEFAISPEVRAVDGFDPFGDYQELLAAGITTVQISPGSNRLMPGQGAVVKLANQDFSSQILREVESLRVILTRAGLSPPTVYEPPVGAVSVVRPVKPTNPQLATSLAQARVGLEALFATAVDGAGDDLRLSAIADAIKSQTQVRWTAGSNAEVQAALGLAKQFELPWVIVDPVDVDELTAENVWDSNLARGVILSAQLRPGGISNPTVPRPGAKVDLPVWERAQQLVAAGAEDLVALRPATDGDLKNLLFSAGILGRGGLSNAMILRTITSNSARVLGVEDRVGAIKPKRDADFVVLSGAPFEPGTSVVATYSGGKEVFKKQSEAEEGMLVRAGTIYSEGEPLRGGTISIWKGKISGLGSDVSVPKGARVRDFGDAVIIPGMIDCSTTLGMGTTLSDATSLDTKLGELLARDDKQIAFGRQGGVTTALLSSTRLPSPVVAFKLTDTPRPLKDPVALRFEVKGNLTAAEASMQRTLKSGKAYAESWNNYEAEYAEYKKALAKYEAEKKKYDAALKQAEAKKAQTEKAKESTKEVKDSGEKDSAEKDEDAEDKDEKEDGKDEKSKAESEPKDKPESDDSKGQEDSKDVSKSSGDSKLELKEPKKPEEPKKPKSNAKLEPYRKLFAKKLVAMVDAADGKALDLAVRIFCDEYDLKTAIVSGRAAASRTEELAKKGVLVVVGPTLVDTDDDGQLVNFAAELAVQNVPIGFQSKASTGVRNLPDAISYSVYRGLGSDDALEALGRGVSEYFGLGSVGDIAIGKDADLVVLSGPPLRLSSEVLAVMIDGKWVYEKGDNQ